jgi:glutamyl-tRNA reductase
MSVLVVGLSHKSAPVATLEQAALSGDALGKLLGDVFQASDVAGSFVVSSCNRVEVYAEVARLKGHGLAVRRFGSEGEPGLAQECDDDSWLVLDAP